MRVVLGILGCLLLLSTASLSAPDAERVIARIAVDGTISPATLDYLKSAIDEASRRDAVALVVRLDTPGGLLKIGRASCRERVYGLV